MQTELDGLCALDLIDQLYDSAYILGAQGGLQFVSRAFFEIIGMANHTLKQGESLKDILEISGRLGVVEQQCMENMLQMSSGKGCDESPDIRLLARSDSEQKPKQAGSFEMAQYKVKRISVSGGNTYYRYERNEDNSQIMQALQRVMHINKTGFYKYDFVGKSYFSVIIF
ncbi:MAG: hypothetical protein COB20_07090 [SAR86 cluster bacterium]|uniref:PAS domain-containing protein n=1 Tax=SAR86 cluster bacterium TaxID=2030880 RepID=A0A2A4X5I1_9GAMM|nr:MAG: hypothetical protein COB20_07090 [SAR86 cluster bacterium]